MPSNLARVLRRKSTWAEKKLWRILRDRRFSAYKFRRQHKVGEHYLDFYCAEARYNLKLDGGQHGFPEHQEEDAKRDNYLREKWNIEVRRFWNSQLKDIRFVRDTVWADLQKRAPHPGNVEPEKRMKLLSRVKPVVQKESAECSHPSSGLRPPSPR
jgi:very-short-patch-repair endonuclease